MARPAKTETPARGIPERTRERILSAALKEFAAKGFAGARVDAIARRAAINKRMLYHYFGNKEKLFQRGLAPENRRAAGMGGRIYPATRRNGCHSGSRPRAKTRTGSGCSNGRRCKATGKR